MTSMIENIRSHMFELGNAIKPKFRAGDTITVYVPTVSKGKTIEKTVTGVCIRVTTSTFTIRMGSDNTSAEVTYSFFTPSRVEVVFFGKVRRARLYYLRDALGKRARIKRDFGRKVHANN